MIGGGAGAGIAGAHRAAARLDGQWQLVAGLFSRDATRNRQAAVDHDVAADRCYDSIEALLAGETARDDGADCVAIVTPNHLHAPFSIACLEAGLNVICEKPMALDVEEARAVARAEAASGGRYFLIHNYSAYAMTLEAAQIVADGRLGSLRMIAAEFANGSRRTLSASETDGSNWWMDPARGGESIILGNLGSHLFHLIDRVSGERVSAVAAELGALVPGRQADDMALMTLRLSGGAIATAWLSMAVPGNGHGLRLRLFGEHAGLDWLQEQSDVLHLRRFDAPAQTLRRGEAWLSPQSRRAGRTKAGQPGGYLEAMANIYRDAAEQIRAAREKRSADPHAVAPATAAEGLAVMRTIEAAIASHKTGGNWISL